MKKQSFLVLAITILSSAIYGQNDPIRVETNLVTLNVSVTNKAGEHIKGLTKKDFKVLDEGREQEILFFSADDDALSIGIVYDMHSMNNDAADVLDALKRFTARLSPADEYFVTVFNDKGSLTANIVPDPDQVGRHLSDPEPGSPRALYDAIIEAGDRIKRSKNPKKYLIVFSDGDDRNSQHDMRQLRDRLRSINVPLYSLIFRGDDMRRISYSDILRDGPRQSFKIGEASELERNIVAEVSRSTGGESVESSIRNRVFLSALATRFLEDARNQYVIGFSPETSDGRWHRLRITVDRESAGRKFKVSSREGYQSLAK